LKGKTMISTALLVVALLFISVSLMILVTGKTTRLLANYHKAVWATSCVAALIMLGAVVAYYKGW
jgi:hypothetical protein